jgi:hypothetical protein
MNSDFKDILKSFLDFQVEFLVVGGFAVMRYTEPRYTKDLDILINNTPANGERVINALKAFGAPLRHVTAADFVTDDGFYQIGVAPNRVDVINKIPGVEFSAAYAAREFATIGGLKVPFISRKHLIDAKLASGRPQDLVDAGALARTRKE